MNPKGTGLMQEHRGSAPRQDNKRSAAPRLVGDLLTHGSEKADISLADQRQRSRQMSVGTAKVTNLGIPVPSDTAVTSQVSNFPISAPGDAVE